MTETRNSLWKTYRFPIILAAAIVGGSLLGLAMGKEALVFKPLGDIFLNALFMIVVPLVFTTICSAVANMASMSRLGRVMGALVAVFLVTGAIAAFLMLVTVKLYPPAAGTALALTAPEEFQPLSTADQIVKAFTVSDFQDLLSRRHMLPLILFSLLFGVSLQMLGERARPLSRAISVAADAMLNLVRIVMYYAPIGLAAYFAALVGDFGPNLLGAYMRSMVVYHVVTFGYFFIAFTLYAWIATEGKGLAVFWKNIIPPAVTALGTQSSTATLPVNLAAAARMGIPADIREMVLPIGATAHKIGRASCRERVLERV